MKSADNLFDKHRVQPPSPAALPRQQAQPADRCSATESTTAAEVRRHRRILAAKFVAASVGVDTVPTEVMGKDPRKAVDAPY